MAHYLVRYSLGENNMYVYPEKMTGVVWKSAIYHHTDQAMVGETDDKLETDGKQIISLSARQAKKLIEEYHASHPKPDDVPGPIPLPRA